MSETADFTLEVRDRDFVRVGQIAPEYTNLKFIDVHNGVGAWELKLPAEHPLLADLKTKGAGIVVTEHWMEGVVHKYRVFSGRMRTAMLSQNAEDPAGTWVVTGVDDNVIAAATRVYPDPANLASAQTAAYWEYSGPAETVMKRAVQVNAGSLAIVSRRYPWLTVPATTGLGGTVQCSSRFDVLGDLLTSLGTAGGLGWEFRQVGAGITFSVYQPQDKTGEVRLDIRNGGLESNELGFTAPSASEVLVLGQGQGEERTVLRVTSPTATAEATAWGLRWEQVKDQRNTDDPAELQQAGDEIIAEQGATVNSLKVVPSDAPGMRLGRDWYRGDRITVVVDGQETTALVTQVAVSITSAGVIRQATVGDPVGFSFDAKIASKIVDVEKRVGQVERLIGQGVHWSDVTGIPTEFPTTWALLGDGNTGRGTTAQRDAYFGVPATDPARATLANRRVSWFNTDLGWEESFYAPAGLSGLTAPGLVTGTAAGWYPVGEGPYVRLLGSAPQSVSPNVYVTAWTQWGTGPSVRRGGSDYFTYDAAQGGIVCVRAGVYEAHITTAQQAGAGTTVVHMLRDGNSVYIATNNLTGQTITAAMDEPNLAMNAGQKLSLFNAIGTYQLHAVTSGTNESRGVFSVRYKGPLLASD